MNFKDILEQRHCCRKFSRKDVGQHKIVSIIEAATLAPSAGNIFSVRIILVKDQEKKNKLAEAALNQLFIAEAPYILVVCSDPSQVVASYGKRGEMYTAQQAGAAIENMFLKITDLELDTCWIGAFDENAVKRILAIPNHVKVEAMMPIGKGEEEISLKKRIERKKIDVKHITFFNRYKLRKEKPDLNFRVD